MRKGDPTGLSRLLVILLLRQKRHAMVGRYLPCVTLIIGVFIGFSLHLLARNLSGNTVTPVDRIARFESVSQEGTRVGEEGNGEPKSRIQSSTSVAPDSRKVRFESVSRELARNDGNGPGERNATEESATTVRVSERSPLAATCPHITHKDVDLLLPFFDVGVGRRQQVTEQEWNELKPQVLRVHGSPAACPKHNLSSDILRKKKIFGLGLSKTGTTSLAAALKRLGYNSCDFCTKFWDVFQHSGSSFWTQDDVSESKLVRSIREILNNTRATTDLPVAVFYRELLAAFPDALFILTTRSLESWMASAGSQFKRKTNNELLAKTRIIPYAAVGYDHHLYPRGFVAHYRQVLQTVPCCQLLVMNIVDRGDGWRKLCSFLGLPPPEGGLRDGFPAINPRDYKGTQTRTRPEPEPEPGSEPGLGHAR